MGREQILIEDDEVRVERNTLTGRVQMTKKWKTQVALTPPIARGKGVVYVSIALQVTWSTPVVTNVDAESA